MSAYVFSPSRLSFYPVVLRSVYTQSAEGWPEDGVYVSAEQHIKLLAEQEQGRVLSADYDGKPITKDAPPLAPEVIIIIERAWRDAQLTATDALVSRHRDEIEQGATTLTEEQYQELQFYRRALRDWPELADFPTAAGRPVMPEWLQAESLKWNIDQGMRV